MNKRQKKKLYKKKTGKNPPKKMRYSKEEYNRAICKPWGGEKPLENYSWDSEEVKKEVKRAVAKAAKAFERDRIKLKEAVEGLKTLFAGIGISLAEVPEPGSYAENTENMVRTAEKLAQRRKTGRSKWK